MLQEFQLKRFEIQLAAGSSQVMEAPTQVVGFQASRDERRRAHQGHGNVAGQWPRQPRTKHPHRPGHRRLVCFSHGFIPRYLFLPRFTWMGSEWVKFVLAGPCAFKTGTQGRNVFSVQHIILTKTDYAYVIIWFVRFIFVSGAFFVCAYHSCRSCAFFLYPICDVFFLRTQCYMIWYIKDSFFLP